MEEERKPTEWNVPDRWRVSQYNFAPEVRASYPHIPKRVTVRDVTLVEGQHQPGVKFTLKDMMRIAHALREAGITMMKASMDNYLFHEFITTVRREIPDSFIHVIHPILDHKKYWDSLDQCKKDLDMLAEAGVDEVDFPGHNSWNVPDHIAKAMTKEARLDRYAEMTRYARSRNILVEAAHPDTPRVPWEDFRELVAVAVEAGATSVAIYDSYGVATPGAMQYFVRKLIDEFGLPVMVHVHNDLGSAEATEIGGILGGATICDCAINGLGDRAGNASLEEMVLQLEMNYGVETGVRLDKLLSLCRLLEEVTGIRFPYVKPVSGKNVFTHASEAHATMVLSQGVDLKYASKHEAYAPEVVGGKRAIRFGAATLTGGMIRLRMEQLGLTFGDREVERITRTIRDTFVAKEKDLSLEEFDALAREVCGAGPAPDSQR
jgi:isopropylmalate/homocitrate/citramalate synthase